ncbi:MAG: tetratricopeptide repeat protein [Spirochaetes bacterium]|nr:tetratricopeptide repeat protein [Spirochaetota bacterium]
MKRNRPITYAICIAFLHFASIAFTPASGEEDLNTAADKLKFETARYFYENRLFDKCLAELHEYLEIYSNGIHRKEAFLMIGEIYFKRFNYSRAAKTYLGLYEEFSNTDEGIQGYFNAAICYEKMGKEKKAKEILKTIIEHHPDSRHAALAQTRLKVLEMIEKPSKSTK